MYNMFQKILDDIKKSSKTIKVLPCNDIAKQALIYDLITFIHVVKPLLAQYPKLSFYLSDFRQHAGLTRLTEATSSTKESGQWPIIS